ncbi:MAG: preprotein translocase subunit SecG [Phycisphaerae bacterium]|nr:preprotein translocase subunit SecG [Phycisphaerae bacterium]
MVIFLGTLFIVICVLLIIVVLLQKGRGGGLGAAFGGAGASAFGTRTGDVFTWVTIVLTGLFLVMAVVTTLVLRPSKPQVTVVQFTPADPAITGPVGITMFCETPDAEIHFTTDGTEPTRQSPTYQKTPVEVRPGLTLRAIAFKQGHRSSLETRATYHLPTATQPSTMEIPAELDAAVEPPAPAAPKPVTR